MPEAKLILEIWDIVYFWPGDIRNVFEHKSFVGTGFGRNAKEHKIAPVKHAIIKKNVYLHASIT